jgi:hypothetical protein
MMVEALSPRSKGEEWNQGLALINHHEGDDRSAHTLLKRVPVAFHLSHSHQSELSHGSSLDPQSTFP